MGARTLHGPRCPHAPARPGPQGRTRFSALQNQFQSAVLAVGSARERVVREADGSFAVARFATLTLSYDHGLCDGYYCGEFLTRLKQALEAPESARP